MRRGHSLSPLVLAHLEAARHTYQRTGETVNSDYAEYTFNFIFRKLFFSVFFSHVVIYLLSFFTPHSWNCILLLLLFQGIFGMFLLSPRRYIQSVWILYVRTHCLNILSHMRVYCPKRCCVWALCPRGWTIMIPKACGNTIKKTGQIWADNIKCGRI